MKFSEIARIESDTPGAESTRRASRNAITRRAAFTSRSDDCQETRPTVSISQLIGVVG